MVATVLWLDGHVNANRPAFRLTGWGTVAAETLRQQNLGDLLPPRGRTGDPLSDCYYFLPGKD